MERGPVPPAPVHSCVMCVVVYTESAHVVTANLADLLRELSRRRRHAPRYSAACGKLTLVVRGDTGGATVQCLLEGPLLPTWHWTAGVVTQHAGHLYISGAVGRWIPGTNTREYAGQYLKKWRTGFEPDENDGPPGQTRRR